MAGQPGNGSVLPAAAHVVGNAFVNQYYNVLHQSPQVVHRFYTDASRLTRAEAGADGAVDTVLSQAEIHQKVMALDYGDFKAEIITVDSQDSLSGGVLVMVTGSLSSKLSGRRNFVQSFFLAPQEKGYFVLNDIFRYLSEESLTSKQVSTFVNGPPETLVNVDEPEASLAVEHQVRDLSASQTPAEDSTVEEVFDSLEQVETSEVENNGGVKEHVETMPVIDGLAPPIAALLPPVPSLEETTEEEVPKKSYASIVSYASILRTKENTGSPVPSTTYSTAPKSLAPAAERVTPYSFSPTVSTGSQDILDEYGLIENEVDGKSVYVKNLPMSVSSSQLDEEFGKFGVVKPGGVILKSQKQGVCYAFVEFEETSSAQTAIEASPFSIGGRQVYIEEKRPIGQRAGGRGSRVPGVTRNDRPSRNDGLRGRGPFGGRGLGGRGTPQDREKDFPNKVRGTGHVRSGSGNIAGGSSTAAAGIGSSGTSVTGVESNRRDMQGGSINRFPRRGGNQTARNGVHGSMSVDSV